MEAAGARPQTPRLMDYVLRGGRLVKKADRKPRASQSASSVSKRGGVADKTSLPVASRDSKQRTLDHFMHDVSSASRSASSQSSARIGAAQVDNSEVHDGKGMSCTDRLSPEYIETLKRAIDSGELQLRTGPWVHPSEPRNEVEQVNSSRQATGKSLLSPAEVRSLVFRPLVFVWAPHLLFKGMVVACPKCKTAATGAIRWGKAQVLHLPNQVALFIAACHSCSRCPAVGRGHSTKKVVQCFRFSAGCPEAIAIMPEYVQVAWTLRRVGGQTLCDEALLDTVRAWATRASWAAATAALNELRATHHQALERKYTILCRMLQLRPVLASSGFPPLTARQTSNMYDEDFRMRTPDVVSELLAEVPGEILSVDWSKDAAARCGEKWVFNAMDSNVKILASVLTATTSPAEVEPVMRDLRARGLEPKAIYVDDECCGAWKCLVAMIWPTVPVVLDAFHAIRRLTQTTASTRHPWHEQFCKTLSQAIFTYDSKLSLTFRQACIRGKVPGKLARRLKAEHVPRFVNEKGAMEVAIGNAIARYTNQSHPKAGPLLTTKTFAAWESLRGHVRAGCLCDPPGVVLNASSAKSSSIGGVSFQKIHVKRGSSALEGFHLQQKGWLGPRVHSRKRGLALLADGSVRFNRRRRNAELQASGATPPVFSAGLLAETDHSYREFVAQGAGRLRGISVACPVRDVADNQLYGIRWPADGGPIDAKFLGNMDNIGPAHHEDEVLPDVQPSTGKQESIARIPPGAGTSDTATSPQAPKVRNVKKRVLQNADREGADQMEVGAESGLEKSSRTRCRHCRLVGSRCRLHKRIQWCEASDIPFNEWVVSIFPSKKAAAQARAACRATQVGMPRGRPRKSGKD